MTGEGKRYDILEIYAFPIGFNQRTFVDAADYDALQRRNKELHTDREMWYRKALDLQRERETFQEDTRRLQGAKDAYELCIQDLQREVKTLQVALKLAEEAMTIIVKTSGCGPMSIKS